MSNTKHIDRIKQDVNAIDKQIEELQGSHRIQEILRLQRLAGEKEKEIKRLEHLHKMDYLRLKDVVYLLRDIEELMSGEEYAHVKDEVPEVWDVVQKLTVEFDGEDTRRFT